MESTKFSNTFAGALRPSLVEMRDFVNLCLTRIGSGEWRAMVINVSVVGLKEADKSTVDSAREFLGWLKQIPRCEVVFVSASDNVHTITITYRR